MTSTVDQRQAAAEKLKQLIDRLKTHNDPAASTLVLECEALARAVAAFHLEGIRFRIFNVDRQLTRSGGALAAEARPLLDDIRRHLEAAGFHTRSHQAPG